MHELASSDRQEAIRAALASKLSAARIAAEFDLPLDFIADARAELSRLREKKRRARMAEQYRQCTTTTQSFFGDVSDMRLASNAAAQLRRWVEYGLSIGLRYGKDPRALNDGIYVADVSKAPWGQIAGRVGISTVYEEKGVNLYRGAK